MLTDHPGAAMDNESQHTPTPADEPLTDDALEQVSGGAEPPYCTRCGELLSKHPNGIRCA
jgi:hypothetical protein